MGLQLKIIFVCIASYAGAYFILSRLTHFESVLRKYLISAIVIIVSAVLLKMVLLAYIMTLFCCLYFTRGGSPSDKLAFFLGIAFVLPNEAGIYLNPGINLGELSYYKILVFALIFPVLISVRAPVRMKRFNLVDYAAIFFIMWQFFMNFRFGNITATMRADLWLVIEYLLPYLAFRFYLQNHMLVFVSIAFALISQMFVAIAEGLLTWKLYESIKQVAGYESFFYSMYKYRHGFLRVEAVFSNPLVLSLFGNFAFLAAYLVYRKVGFAPPKSYRSWIAWGGLAAAIGGIFFTGSRAGMAGILMILVLYVVFKRGIEMQRDPKNKILLGGLVVLVLGIVLGGDAIKDNFGYRYQLFEISQGVIASNFFTGSFQVLDDPRMQVLRQGEGIIDLVNSYIYFALFYGMPAMIALMIAFFGGILKTYTALRKNESEETHALGMFVMCSLGILSFNLATTSPLGWSYLWIWIILALCSNVIASVNMQGEPKKPLIG